MCNIWWESNKNDVEKELEYLQDKLQYVNAAGKNFVEEWQRTNEVFHFQSCEISGEFRRIFIQWITLRCWEKSKGEQRLVSTYKHQYWLSYAIVQFR